MKKRLFAICCALLLLIATAAQAREVTITDYMEANTVSALLERHSSAALLQHINDTQSAIWLNRDYRYSAHRTDETIRAGDTEYLMTDKYCLMLSYIRFTEGVFPIPFIMLDTGLGESVHYDVAAGLGTDFLFDPETTAKEQVQSIEEADGKLILTTWLTGKDFIDAWGEEMQAGSYCELKYTLDAETLELLEDVETVVDANGKPLSESLYYQLFGAGRLQSTQQVLYDVPMPEDAEYMARYLGEYLDADKDDSRTVTYVLFPGTERELVLSSTGKKGYGVLIATGGIDYDLYLDAELTQPAPSDDLQSDRRLYVKLSGAELRDDT